MRKVTLFVADDGCERFRTRVADCAGFGRHKMAIPSMTIWNASRGSQILGVELHRGSSATSISYTDGTQDHERDASSLSDDVVAANVEGKATSDPGPNLAAFTGCTTSPHCLITSIELCIQFQPPSNQGVFDSWWGDESRDSCAKISMHTICDCSHHVHRLGSTASWSIKYAGEASQIAQHPSKNRLSCDITENDTTQCGLETF